MSKSINLIELADDVSVSSGNVTLSNISLSPTSSMMFRNKIINGDMRIDQRNGGASVGPFAIASAGYKGVDRWFIATDTMTSQRITGNAPTGFSNYLKLTKTSTSNIDIRQTIELDSAGQAGEFSNGKIFTLSFYAKSASGGETLDFFAYFRQGVATGTATSLTAPSGVTLSTSWVRYEVLFTIDVSPSASDLCIAFAMHTAATELHLTGVQLEEGAVATPFEHRPYGLELSLAQRYYFRTTEGIIGTGWNNTTNQAVVVTNFPTPMRIKPTALEQSGTASDYNIRAQNSLLTCNSVPVFNSTTNTFLAVSVFATATTLNVGEGSAGAVSTNGFLAWSTEL